MKKGQSLVIQFVIFFVSGFAIFLTIGGFFKYQSDVFRESLLSSNAKLFNSYFSSVVTSINSCKECENSTIIFRIPKQPLGYPLKFELDKGLNVSVVGKSEYYFSSLHKLNETLESSGWSDSTKPISLTFSRTKNKLVVE